MLESDGRGGLPNQLQSSQVIGSASVLVFPNPAVSSWSGRGKSFLRPVHRQLLVACQIFVARVLNYNTGKHFEITNSLMKGMDEGSDSYRDTNYLNVQLSYFYMVNIIL